MNIKMFCRGIALFLFFVEPLAYSQDLPPDSVPPGNMPGDLHGSDLRDLLRWKSEHSTDPQVQAFDKSHGELLQPSPASAPDPSQFQKMQQYSSELSSLKSRVESQTKATQSVNQTPSKTVSTACKPSMGDNQEKINSLQLQVTQLTEKLDAAQRPTLNAPEHNAPFNALPQGMGSSMGNPKRNFSGPSPTSIDPDEKLRMQTNLVAQQVSQISDQTQDLKDQIQDFKDKECAMPGDEDNMDGPPGGGPPDGDFPRKRADSSDAEDSLREGPPSDSGFSGGKMPNGGSLVMQELLLDLPDDLQSQMDQANKNLTQAKSKLRTAKRSWMRKCKEMAQSQSPMKSGMGDVANQGGMPQMSGGTGQGFGGANFAGSMNFGPQSQGQSQGPFQGANNFFGNNSVLPQMGYGPNIYSSPLFFTSAALGNYGYGNGASTGQASGTSGSGGYWNPGATGFYGGYSPYMNYAGYSSAVRYQTYGSHVATTRKYTF